MTLWWVNNLAYLFFWAMFVWVLPSTACWVFLLLADPSKQTYFFNGPFLYFDYLLFLFLCLLTNISILLTKSGDKKLFRLTSKSKLVMLKWTNSNFEGSVLKTTWFQTSGIMYNSSNHYSRAWYRFQ